jgi:transposase
MKPRFGHRFAVFREAVTPPARPPASGRRRDARAGRDRSGWCGAKLFFLPPYSPDLNPIEQVFAKLKTLLRKADERSVEATWRRIGSILGHFSPRECAAYLENSGYASA